MKELLTNRFWRDVKKTFDEARDEAAPGPANPQIAAAPLDQPEAGVVKHVEELIALVQEGKFLEAIERFYAEDASMQENLDPPRVGLAALLENERKVLERVPDIHVEEIGWVFVDRDRAAINWVFAFTDSAGRKVRLDEIAYQEWRDGKIVRERFYYDPAQRSRSVD